MSRHECHNPFCDKACPPSMFSCRSCWFSLPRRIRARIWATYVPGQEVTKTPTGAYLNAAADAINYWRHEHEARR